MNSLVVLTALLACAAAQYLAPYSAYGHHGYAAPLAYAHHGAYSAYPYAHHGYAAPAYAHHGYAAPAYAHHAAPAHIPTYASQYHSQDEYGQASYGYAQPGQAASAVRDAYGNVAGSYYYINPEGEKIEVSYTAGVDGFKVHSNALPVAPVADLVQAPAPVYTGVAPEPVQDTPEVVAARAAHLAAHAEADHRRKRSVHYAHHGHRAHGFGYSFAYPAYHHGYAHHGYARRGYALHH